MNEGREKAILTVPLPKLLLPNFCAGAGLPNFELWQYHCQNRRKEGKKFWIVAIQLPERGEGNFFGLWQLKCQNWRGEGKKFYCILAK